MDVGVSEVPPKRSSLRAGERCQSAAPELVGNLRNYHRVLGDRRVEVDTALPGGMAGGWAAGGIRPTIKPGSDRDHVLTTCMSDGARAEFRRCGLDVGAADRVPDSVRAIGQERKTP